MKGDCWNNVVSESFFATFKSEAFGDLAPADRAAAERIVREYIDGHYNTKRRHSFIDYECPVEFELRCQLAAAAASSICPLGGGRFAPSCDSGSPARLERALSNTNMSENLIGQTRQLTRRVERGTSPVSPKWNS